MANLPTPTALKIIRGNPGKRPLNKREPKPEPGIPKPPAELKGEARREWRRLTKEMSAVGMLTHLDRGDLAAYCQAWARWLEAEAQMVGANLVVDSPRGPKRNPLLVVIDKELDRVRHFGAELGLSPVARTRVHVEPKAPKGDDLEQFARKRKRDSS